MACAFPCQKPSNTPLLSQPPETCSSSGSLASAWERIARNFHLELINICPNSFFKTLTNQVVTIELKNDIRIRGTLKSVDQYLNIKLDDIDVLDLDKYPHLSSVKNMFIRGSVVRYVILPRSEVDVGLLEDATRREAANQAGKAR
ncbi:small nuclear ribonucleoprotein [Aspergillus ochraceoroseus]|uniref:Small nuclear ribonucleoprotein n=1 Tax=Aspergillus ochraceoroseus TaxID=138278 RepID=A0A0F8X2Y7_9EURO|nr:small nuclear ribonucleoprotein [Aspergillus ochraceoroseus]